MEIASFKLTITLDVWVLHLRKILGASQVVLGLAYTRQAASTSWIKHWMWGLASEAVVPHPFNYLAVSERAIFIAMPDFPAIGTIFFAKCIILTILVCVTDLFAFDASPRSVREVSSFHCLSLNIPYSR
ncbi:hypothetical protein KQX54_011840 [Cotesia glomerata]|uniref:Uncharacterized protein n=1 Tax=Cotesia glomerata TaxID=32391 RepID=A0AAV7IF00_COTGL|nr:hypothetical protein KQX54_011840 [Cotesia glomerata]